MVHKFLRRLNFRGKMKVREYRENKTIAKLTNFKVNCQYYCIGKQTPNSQSSSQHQTIRYIYSKIFTNCNFQFDSDKSLFTLISLFMAFNQVLQDTKPCKPELACIPVLAHICDNSKCVPYDLQEHINARQTCVRVLSEKH